MHVLIRLQIQIIMYSRVLCMHCLEGHGQRGMCQGQVRCKGECKDYFFYLQLRFNLCLPCHFFFGKIDGYLTPALVWVFSVQYWLPVLRDHFWGAGASVFTTALYNKRACIRIILICGCVHIKPLSLGSMFTSDFTAGILCVWCKCNTN